MTRTITLVAAGNTFLTGTPTGGSIAHSCDGCSPILAGRLHAPAPILLRTNGTHGHEPRFFHILGPGGQLVPDPVRGHISPPASPPLPWRYGFSAV